MSRETMNSVQDEMVGHQVAGSDAEEKPKRGGGKTKQKQRRNYVAECAALQARIDMTIKLLKRGASSTDAARGKALLEIALETLIGTD